MAERILQHRLKISFTQYQDKIALDYSNRQVTYGNLDRQSDIIAHWLREKDLPRETLVGVLIEDKIDLITIMIGILKAGCVFMPLDTNCPPSRLEVMIKTTAAKYILCDRENFTRISSVFQGNQEVERIIYDQTLFNETAGENANRSLQWPELDYTPQDHIYIYFTSGSTGTPRAMIGINRSLCHFIDWEIETFGIDENTRVSQLTHPTFDAFLRDIFVPLCAGGRTCIPAGREIVLEAAQLANWVQQADIRLIHCTPSLFRVLNSPALTPQHFQNLEFILLSGEKIEPANLVNWFTVFAGRIKLVNLWGTSETTLAKTCYFIQEPDIYKERISVGKPIKGARVIVLDRDMNVCDQEVAGEVYIRTPYRTGGYLNNPELNQQRFIQNPFNPKPGDLIHKTGDLGKLLPDGNLDISGRADRQVKIRGIRIELEEIESIMVRYPGVSEAAAIKKSTSTENEMLCGFVVGNFPTDPDEEIREVKIKEFLSGKLPDYMVPNRIVIMDKIPRTSTGKVDYETLADFMHKETLDYEAPRDETQKMLAQLWMEILRIKKTGINNNFFDLGGNSLNIMTLIAKIHQKFDVKITLGEIFNNLTIKQQAEIIKSAKSDRFFSIGKSEEKEFYALSPAQKRLYILHQANEIDTTYNIPGFMTMEGKLKKATLGEIFKKLIQRHESLRTSFEIIDDRPVQRIKKYREIHFEMEYYDTRSKAGASGVIPPDFIRTFDLRQGPLLRVGLKKIEETKYIFMFDMHHIITDGTSQEIFTKEFLIMYENGQLPALKLQYKDFSQWQNRLLQRGEIKEQEKYWLKEFRELPPILNLPTDYPRPQYQSFEGRVLGFGLGVEETARLNRLADHKEVTLYTLLLTIFYVMLYRLTGQETIAMGSFIAGRRHADLQDIIGMFVNTLALTQYPHGDKTFTGFLEEVKQRTVEAFENQDYPFEDLVEKLKLNRDLSRNPLFDVIFLFHTLGSFPVEMPIRDHLSELKISKYRHEKTSVKFDLTLYIMEVDEKLDCNFEYCTKLFKKQTIERLVQFFKKTVSMILAEPGIQLKEIEITAEEERKRLLYDFCDAKAGIGYPADKLIHELFVEQTERTPDHTALIGQIPKAAASPAAAVNEMPMQITYKELNKKSHQLACLLAGKGLRPDTIVAVMLDRTPRMVTGILGILKAGGAYLPLDPDYPRERIDYMLKDSNASILVTTPGLSEKLLIVNCQLLMINEETLDRPGLNTTPQEANSIDNLQLKGTGLAYIIYTSGTTGKPKGTMIEHKNVVRLFFNDQFQFDFNRHDVWTLFHSFCFDFSVWEMYGALLFGGKLILIPSLVAKDSPRYLEVLKKEQVTVLNQVPTAFYNLAPDELNAPGKQLNLRYIIFGGEALQPGKLTGWREKYPGTKLINMYGITETTVHVTYKGITDEEIRENVSNIGKPIPTLRTYIVDKYLRLLPAGIGGELCVGGLGVARGYLNRPELTWEKFINYKLQNRNYNVQNYKNNGIHGFMQPCNHASMQSPHHPSISIPHSPHSPHLPPLLYSPIYRTGDLAKLLPNGEMEYLGRIDQQVKIRGFRIELGEIENQLIQHPGIKEAVVVLRQKSDQDRYLCAYIVPENRETGITGLKDFLAGSLPSYMIPTYFMPMEKIPLTPGGKLDREALPNPEIKAAVHDNAPVDEIEKKLAEMWANSLLIDKRSIDLDANFFDLGGHSLTAAVLLARLHREFDVTLQLMDIFNFPVLKELAGLIKTKVKKMFLAIEPAEKREYYTLSSAQKRIYILQQMIGSSTAYNMPESFEMKDKPVKEQLEKTFRQLINRHESLRTSFHLQGEEPAQKIHDRVEFEIEYYDINEVRAEAREQTTGNNLDTNLSSRFIRPFDLSRAPLLRVGLIETEDGRTHLLVDMHHIISDGTSHNILEKDFYAVYTGEGLSPLRICYKDFSQWQNSSDIKDNIKLQAAYWLEQFQEESPVLNIPMDYPRPPIRSFAGSWIDFEIPAHQLQPLKTLAANENATLFMMMLTVYIILQAKLSNQDDIVVGIPVAGRRHADLEQVIGMFVNTLPLRNFPQEHKTFKEFLGEVRKQTLKAFENQEYPFEELVENVPVKRDGSRNPLFDVIFSLQSVENQAASDQVESLSKGLKLRKAEANISKYDLVLEGQEVGNKLAFSYVYCTKLFKKETIVRSIDYLKSIVSFILENPDGKITDIEILNAEEKQRILYEFNDTAAAYSRNKTVHHLFLEQVKRTPDHIAVVGQVLACTYKELNEKSGQLARVLRAKGVDTDKIVGIMVDHRVEMIAALMGVLKAGGAFLPVDPRLPRERVRYMLTDSCSPIVLTRTDIMEKYSSTAKQDRQRLNPGSPETGSAFASRENRINAWDTGETIMLDHLEAPGNEDIREDFAPVTRTRDLAYVIYTSGSTGAPNGVMVEHQGLVNLCSWHRDYYSLSSSDRATKYAGFGFDATIWEIFPYLLAGASVFIPGDEIKLDMGQLSRYFTRHRVTISFLPTQVGEQFMKLENQGMTRLLVGGDKLRVFTDPGYAVYNNYGPTENTVVATACRVQWDSDNIPIGRPIANNRIYILDKHNKQLQPIGLFGELCLSGDSLARGYSNNPEKTKEKFVNNPWEKGERMFKTGDLARWLPDGNIEFLGRIDQQVKIRGYRIELAEIEQHLLKHEEIKEVVVLDKENEEKEKYLVAYVVSNKTFEIAELKDFLSRTLPDYMVPSYFWRIEQMPLTPNGKLDRRALMKSAENIDVEEYISPGNEMEKIVAAAWQEVLGRHRVGRNDNFFELGGTSLSIIRLSNRFKEIFAKDIPVVAIFRYPTVRSFAGYLNREQQENQEVKIRAKVLDEGKISRTQRLRKKKEMN